MKLGINVDINHTRKLVVNTVKVKNTNKVFEGLLIVGI